jgi:hypothetical protein
MTGLQVAKCIAFISSSWGNKPLDKVAAETWGAELLPYPFDGVIATLRALLLTQDWRPSLAQILKPIAPASEVKSAEAAFETVWGQIGEAHEDRKVSSLEQRAVDRLGKWKALGQWQLDKRHFHLKAFREVYDDLVDSGRATELRAIAGGQQRAIGGAA